MTQQCDVLANVFLFAVKASSVDNNTANLKNDTTPVVVVVPGLTSDSSAAVSYATDICIRTTIRFTSGSVIALMTHD